MPSCWGRWGEGSIADKSIVEGASAHDNDLLDGDDGSECNKIFPGCSVSKSVMVFFSGSDGRRVAYCRSYVVFLERRLRG